MFDAGKRAKMNPQKIHARKVNTLVNKVVHNYVDDNQKPSIIDDFGFLPNI